MAVREIRACDVYPTREGNRYRIELAKIAEATNESETVYVEEADLSDKAVERLKNFVNRAIKPPTPRTPKG